MNAPPLGQSVVRVCECCERREQGACTAWVDWPPRATTAWSAPTALSVNASVSLKRRWLTFVTGRERSTVANRGGRAGTALRAPCSRGASMTDHLGCSAVVQITASTARLRRNAGSRASRSAGHGGPPSACSATAFAFSSVHERGVQLGRQANKDTSGHHPCRPLIGCSQPRQKARCHFSRPVPWSA